MKGAEAHRVEGDSVLSKRVYFYTDIGNGIIPEDNVGNVVHAVWLNNIYDLNKDPLGIRKEVSRTVSVESQRANEAERRIHEAGFDGYIGSSSGKGSLSIVLIGEHKVPVDVEGIYAQTGQSTFRPVSPLPEPVITDTTGGRDVISKYIVPREFRELAKVPGSGVTEEGPFLVLDEEGVKKAKEKIPNFEKRRQILMPNGTATYSFHQDEIDSAFYQEAFGEAEKTYRETIADFIGEDSSRKKAVEKLLELMSTERQKDVVAESKGKSQIKYQKTINSKVLEAAKEAGVDLADRESPIARALLVQTIVNDAVYATRVNSSAIGWYDEKVRKCLGYAGAMLPELDPANIAFFATPL